MATVTPTLSNRKRSDGKSEIMLRVLSGHDFNGRIKSGLFINPERFKDGKIIIPRLKASDYTELRSLEAALLDLEAVILNYCEAQPHGAKIDKDLLLQAIERHRDPDNHPEPSAVKIYDLYEKFLADKSLAHGTEKQHRVLINTLRRFETYMAVTQIKGFVLTIESLTVEILSAFKGFFIGEAEICKRYPDIYKEVPSRERPATTRSENTLHATLSRLRAFVNWCVDNHYTTNYPFARKKHEKNKYHIQPEIYGTPYFLTLEERDTIANCDLSAKPRLAIQRDIFIFHCLVGCRVSDLLTLTKDHIINGAVEYIPQKTRGKNRKVVRVPLHPEASAIVERYANVCGNALLPFISAQKYNDAIKDIFLAAGITRMVTVLNPHTGETEQRPINEIASSHIARRSFVGNLYKKVQDPNLIGKLSGHVEGSRAFERYRTIDEEMMIDTINLL